MEEETQTQTSSWLNEEIAVLKNGTLTEIEVDFSKKFEEWHDEENQTMKALVPVTQNGIKKTWWLNKRNPIYADLIKRGREGQTKFKVSTSGEKKQTRYTFVEET